MQRTLAALTHISGPKWPGSVCDPPNGTTPPATQTSDSTCGHGWAEKD